MLFQKVYSSNPSITDPLITEDSEPLAAISDVVEASFRHITESRQAWEIFMVVAHHTPRAGDVLPLLSQPKVKGISRPPASARIRQMSQGQSWPLEERAIGAIRLTEGVITF